MKMDIVSCIYTITCLVNNKIYIGQSANFNNRRRNHTWRLENNVHENPYLQRAWNKYGRENFSIEILEEYPPNLLSSMEHYWTTVLDTNNPKNGYNLKGTNPNGRGYKLAEETKLKMSLAGKGRVFSKEHRERISIGRKGIIHSEESIIKATETKRKRAAERGYWHSPEALEKQKAKLRGRKLPRELVERQQQNRKIKAEQRGYWVTEETKLKRSRPVLQYSLDGELVKEYCSAKQASENTGVSRALICKNASNKSKSAGGFIWRYKFPDKKQFDK